MSAANEKRADWPERPFWQPLDRPEGDPWGIPAQDVTRRGLHRLSPRESAQLRAAWQQYSEVIAELDQPSADLAAQSTCAGRADQTQR